MRRCARPWRLASASDLEQLTREAAGLLYEDEGAAVDRLGRSERLVSSAAGMDPDLVEALVEKGYHGIVIAGTGLGHVNKPLYPALKKAIKEIPPDKIQGYLNALMMKLKVTELKCETCGVRPAAVTVTELDGGKYKSRSLCDLCAEERGDLLT